MTPNEGFLVLDKAGVQINNSSSLIGSYAALSAYDTNHDGILTAAEADAAGIKVWVDANDDGIGETGELATLDQLGVASINLSGVKAGNYDHGNIIATTSTFNFTDGRTGQAADVWLMTNGALSTDTYYEFDHSLVYRYANGEIDELVNSQGRTVNAGAADLEKVLDVAGNNTLAATTAAIVTLVGAKGDTLVGGTGADTLVALGDNESVVSGSGTNT
ncbi:hypothetical protein WDZ92_48925, partial [Nostoc sp. NIES-2111]